MKLSGGATYSVSESKDGLCAEICTRGWRRLLETAGAAHLCCVHVALECTQPGALAARALHDIISSRNVSI